MVVNVAIVDQAYLYLEERVLIAYLGFVQQIANWTFSLLAKRMVQVD